MAAKKSSLADYRRRLKEAGIARVVDADEYHRREMKRTNNMTSAESQILWKTMSEAQKAPYIALHQDDCQRYNKEKEEKGLGKGKAGTYRLPTKRTERPKKQFRKWTATTKEFGKRCDTKYVGSGKTSDVIGQHDSSNLDRNSQRYQYFQLLFGSSHVVNDYIGWVTKMRDGVLYHPDTKKYFAFRMPQVVLEYVKFTDFSGPTERFAYVSGGRSDCFNPDVHIEAAMQASSSHYAGSGYDRAHLAVWQNWTRNLKILCLSFHVTNIVPALPLINSHRLETVKRNFRQRILEEGHGIIISTTIYEGPPANIKWLVAQNDDPIPIPTAFGKILITRRIDGVHIRGWKILNEAGKASETISQVDPFLLMQTAGCPFTANSRLLFRSIEEGKTQRLYQDDPDFLRFTPQIQAYRALFDNATQDDSRPSTSSAAFSSTAETSDEPSLRLDEDNSFGSDTDFED